MATPTCPNCGAPLKPEGQFCAYCGTAIPQPLASGSEAPGPGRPGLGGAPLVGTPASRQSKARAVVVVVVVVLVIAGGIGAYVYFTGTPAVTINGFFGYAPDDVCHLGIVPTQGTGSSDSPGADDEVELSDVPNFNATSCTIQGLSTNTSGFMISGPSVPLTIAPGATAILFFNLSLPGSAWSGNVNLIFR